MQWNGIYGWLKAWPEKRRRHALQCFFRKPVAGRADRRGIAAPVIDKLSQSIARILGAPDMANRLTTEGMEVVAGTPEEFAGTLRHEMTKWAKVIKDAGIKTE